MTSSSLPPIPPSPTQSYASTAFPTASLNLPSPPPPPHPNLYLSGSDVKSFIAAYESLTETAKAYRKELASVASAASAFGAALETCARCKGAGDTADGLMGASGLQYLVASNLHILSESLFRGFEVPIMHELDRYKEKNAQNEDKYRKEANDKTRELRKREQEHLKLARQKKRDLTAFRSALVDLTYQIDELDGLKYSYIRSALDLSQETSLRILDSSALVVRAEIEVFEKIAQKGWDSSGGLDDLIARAADPFSTSSSYGNGDGEIFSILPTESILASPHGALSRAGSVSGVHGASATEGKYQSLTGALSPNGDYDEFEDEDARSIFSGGFSNSGAGGDNLDLPGFAPSVSSAGWDHQSYSSAAPLQDLPPCSPEDGGTPPMSVPGSGNWDGSDGGDGSNSTLRERSIH